MLVVFVVIVNVVVVDVFVIAVVVDAAARNTTGGAPYCADEASALSIDAGAVRCNVDGAMPYRLSGGDVV